MKTAWLKATKENGIEKMHSSISKVNQDYIHRLIASKNGYVTEKRIQCIRATLIKFCDVLEKDIPDATKDEITQIGGLIHKADMSIKTKQDDISNIREAFKYWFGEDEEFPKVVAGLKRPTGKGQLRLPKEMPSEEQIFNMIKACPNSRDKFYIGLIGLDGGLRPVEARSICMGDIKKDTHGYFIEIHTAKKSGDKSTRVIRIIKSEPYFVQWMKEYPLPKDDKNFLFINYSNFEQLSKEAMESLFKRLRKKLKIKGRFYQYLLRHSLLTRMSKDARVSIPVLKKFAGHSQKSNVIGEYQHFGDDDIKDMQLQYNGLIDKKEESVIETKPITCPKCKTKNEYDAEFCLNCNMALSQKRMIDIQDLFSKNNKMMFEQLKKLIQEEKRAS